VKDDDPRWKYGIPPAGNANFAWMQHMIHHLAPHGSMALLLANGSMSTNTNNEGEIRKALIEADLVECMVALPGQLFTNTQIPACIWLLTRSKAGNPSPSGRGVGVRARDRRGETLFIDARNLGYMKDRVLREFAVEDIRKIADTFHSWRSVESWAEQREAQQQDTENVGVPNVTPTYEDIPGFCKSAKLDDIKKHDYVLTPGRYVGAAAQEDDGEPFEDKMARLTARLSEQFAEGASLEAAIRRNLVRLGYTLEETK
jgi:type I restriction enzyme M protein